MTTQPGPASRGYEQICPRCKGAGVLVHDHCDPQEQWDETCTYCEGQGVVIEPPLTQEEEEELA